MKALSSGKGGARSRQEMARRSRSRPKGTSASAEDAAGRPESHCKNPNYPPIRSASTSMFGYLMLPLRRRGCVGLKEIGTQHTTLDVFLCACLGVPGLVYAFTAHNELAWLRLLVAVEFFVISFTSVLADGMLRGQSMDASSRDGWMVYDRKTAVMHILTLIAVFIYRGVEGHASRGQLGIAVALGLVSLAIFHRRLHYTFVEQRWRPARICARLWHVGGTVAPLIGLLPRFPL